MKAESRHCCRSLGKAGRAKPIALVTIAAAMVPATVLADLNDLTFQNPIEQAGARANQAVYDQLTGGATPTCAAQLADPAGACTGVVFEIFSNVRELVETANQLTRPGQASTRYSLGLDQENLGFALRWTAAEELAAQGSSATQFSSSQLNSLASRLSALRFSARGSATVWNNETNSESLWVSNEGPALGGGASADTEESIASRWSAFIDGSFGYGRKDDTSDPFNLSGTTGAEDAFDFDGQEISLGVDYRVNPSVVVGALLGYTDRSIDFDSSVSIVDGTIDGKGESLILYALWDSDRFHVSGSLGGQWLDYDLVRRITYPSLNPLVAPIDETTRSDTKSQSITATFGAGVTFNAGAFGFDAYLNAQYQDLTIDGFREGGGSGFEFDVGDQDLNWGDTALGIKLQYAFTPDLGVFVPYLRGEYHKEFDNDSRRISTLYAGLPAGTSGAEDFALATDEPDDDYFLAAGGLTVVLKNGLQGFIQYQQVFELDTFEDRAITGGIRFEF